MASRHASGPRYGPILALVASLATSLATSFALPANITAQPANPSATPGRAATATSASDTARTARLSRGDLGRIRGNPAATVWLVVMSDFECPYCKVWHDETGPRIERTYVATGKVRVAYLNYIAVASHRNAPAAHEAAMCAAEQERFWPMADAIFAAQHEWKSHGNAPAFFDAIAVRLRLDLPRYRACIRDGVMRPMIAADQDRVMRLGMGATPAFLVGGQRIIGAQPYEVFEQAIEQALARSAARPTP